MHTLYNVETQIPVFFRITEASVHDSKAMIEIPYEPGSYYIFDRGYNNFKMLYKIHQIEAYFIVRAKIHQMETLTVFWWQSFNTIWNWIEVHTKCYKYLVSHWQIKLIWKISLIKLNFNMKKNDLDQMDQVYLMFNLSQS